MNVRNPSPAPGSTAASTDWFRAFPFPVVAANPDPAKADDLYVAYADKGTASGDRADVFCVESLNGGTLMRFMTGHLNLTHSRGARRLPKEAKEGERRSSLFRFLSFLSAIERPMGTAFIHRLQTKARRVPRCGPCPALPAHSKMSRAYLSPGNMD